MRFVSIAIFLLACGENPGVDAGHDASTASDSGAGDAGSDAGVDAGPPPPCVELLADRRFAIDPDPDVPQIHASAVFDGEGIWVAYNKSQPDDTGHLDIYAVRLGCDGRHLLAPFPVQSDILGNDIDPEIAIAGDRILIVWQVDLGTPTANLQIRYRAFALDGTPMGDQEQLVTTRAGTPIAENHFAPDLAVSGDRAVIASTRGVPDVPTAQAFAHELDIAGDTLESPSEDMVSHRNASVAIASDGAVWIAYDREPDGANANVYARSFADLGSIAEPALTTGVTTTYGADLLGSGASVWAAFAGSLTVGTADVRLVDLALPVAERMPAVIGATGRDDHSPKIGVSPTGALAIAWYRTISGYTSELYIAPFTAGNPPVIGDPVLVQGTPGAVFYRTALTYLDDGHWFLAWSEGTSPDLRLVGRVVALP